MSKIEVYVQVNEEIEELKTVEKVLYGAIKKENHHFSGQFPKKR